MKSGVSEIVGQAIFSDGTKADAYNALRPLICASCGGVIAAAAMFTRTAASMGQGLQLWPRCRACVPFDIETVKPALEPIKPQRSPQRSPLLQSLLTPVGHEDAAASLNRSATEQANVDERGRIDARVKSAEAMRRRLGPALERARRLRSGKR
jgi:hypothetical protein